MEVKEKYLKKYAKKLNDGCCTGLRGYSMVSSTIIGESGPETVIKHSQSFNLKDIIK